MWMLSFIPSELLQKVIHGIVIFSILLYIGAYFLVRPYSDLAKFVAMILLAAGLYFEGGYFVEKQWRDKVEEYKQKVKEAEEKSEKVNTVIQTKYVEKIKYIDRVKEGNVQIVEKIVTKYDNLCTLSNAAIVLHNSASQNVLAPSSGTAIEGTSNVKASELIGTVVDNYSTYYKVKEQLTGWQEWYKEQKKIYESVK